MRFGQKPTDSFSRGQAPSPVLHIWSLAVEERFYLVWPALIVLVIVVGSRRRATTVRRRLPWLWFLAAGLAAASCAWSIATTPADPTGAYFATATRDHMAIGYAVYLVDALEKRLRLPTAGPPSL